MLTRLPPTAVDSAVARLDAWLDTMRGPAGYGGPVAHWWQQSLIYTGPGFDWRYEGIIAGYLLLWERTQNTAWLAKARRAGDDLVRARRPDGHYPASQFENNPGVAGTPHEAAADLGLLLLARALRTAKEPSWEPYAACAHHNLQVFYIEQLWDSEAQAFRDSPTVPSFVPNKAATACEALFLLTELTGEDRWVETYALPTLRRIFDHQVHGPGILAGAIAQNSFGRRRGEKYFPIYIARCVPALLAGTDWTGEACFAEAALQAMRFIARWAREDGTLPTVIYADRRVNRWPSWIAPLGDVLRVAAAVRPIGFDADLSAIEARLCAGQDESGGIQTATGFAAQAGGRADARPDVRDLLHVVGWCDKAFRHLAAQVEAPSPELLTGAFERRCTFRGRSLHMRETAQQLEIVDAHGVCYRWRKGAAWPETARPEFWLR